MSEKILRLENITMQFGGVIAVNNMNLEVGEGEIVSLIGPNGAGKTTAFNVITGVYQPTNGAVWYRGEKIVENYPQGKMRKLYKGEHAGEYTHALAPTPDKITRMGMARTFQNIRLWKDQTVFDNVLTAMHCRATCNLLTATFHLNRQEEARQRQRVEELLAEVNLSDVSGEKANSLPYGKQRRLEIARALATDPQLLLLDEPAAGMNPQETDELTAFIGEIRSKFGLTVFLIEHLHGPGHGHLRPDLCAGLRQADCRRHTGGDPEQSARHRRVPGGGGRCLKSNSCGCPTAASRLSGASTWRCRTARSSP